jgi:hypothetical protein
MKTDHEVLLAMHEKVIQAHVNADVEGWLDLETAEFISANRGVISYPTKEERRAGRLPYLQATTFSEYRDVVEPIVRISEDGMLGWVFVQVKVSGTQLTSANEEVAVGFESAWIELYEKRNGRWLCVGNVSNMKPKE